MAKAVSKPRLEVVVQFTVNEIEARALDDLAGYGTDAFIEAFYEKLGKAYMQKHESGLREFLDTIRDVVRPGLRHIEDAREALNPRFPEKKV